MKIPLKLKIRLFKTSKYTYNFVFQKKYQFSKKIIPIGSACHPAYVLSALSLRNESLPFDWLLTHPVKGLSYVTENIKTEFKFFLEDLKKNKKGEVYASHYDFSVFFHHPDIIDKGITYQTFIKRIKRFLTHIKTEECFYLYSTISEDCNSFENINFLLNSVCEFKKLLKENDKLLFYIIYDESREENKDYCQKLLKDLSKIEKVSAMEFVLQRKKYGLWGYESEFINFIRGFNINLRSSFPKFKIEKLGAAISDEKVFTVRSWIRKKLTN